jgi:hypothetical protein
MIKGWWRRRRSGKIACVLSAALVAAAPGYASAADLRKNKITPPEEAAFAGCKETKESALPADVFGFGSGSDVADPGSLGAGLEYGGAFGRRGGSFSGHSMKASVPYGLLPCLEVGPSLNIGLGRGTDRLTSTTDRTTAFGGQIEIKYKLLGRATHGIGLTLVTEAGYSWVNTRLTDLLTPFVGSERSRQFSNTYKVLADFAVVPDRLFGAFSIEFAHAYAMAEPLGLNGCVPAAAGLSAWCRSSSLNLRAAAALKVADPLFGGVELQHLRAYDGAFLNRLSGQAWFVGPTFFWEPAPGKLSVSGTLGVQVAGKAQGAPGSLDTTNFSHHIAKLKLGYTF